jgi:dolichol-phosphate mannosyltransferase
MVRSFGFDNALTFALDQTSADLVITMTSDLQDPPEIIAKFLQEYETGHNHVAARVTDRKSISLRRRVMTNFFYFLAEKLTDGMYPRNVSDFRLMSRSVYSDVIKLREQNRFLRGIVAWTGHKCKIIEIERPERQYGSSKFDSLSLRKVVPWALSSIFSFTPKPLEFVAIASILFSGATFLLLLTLTVFWLIVGVPFAGYGSIVGGVILLFSTLFLILGIFSLYLNLIFNEIKARPLYLVEGNTQANN